MVSATAAPTIPPSKARSAPPGHPGSQTSGNGIKVLSVQIVLLAMKQSNDESEIVMIIGQFLSLSTNSSAASSFQGYRI